MKKNNFLLTIISILTALSILMISDQRNSFAETIDQAIKLYQDADIEKAKNVFENLAKEKSGIKKRQIALAYLALIELASRNEAGANDHIFRILMLDPSFDLKEIQDINPDIEKHFNRIKSKDIFQGILYYQNAEIEKAKDIFEKIIKQDSKNEEHQVALVYLALIEIASRNEAEADTYLSRLVSLNSGFDLKNISDINPGIEERFKQIKKSGGKILTIKDTVEPSGEIRGIKDTYTTGETVSYTVFGKDNNSLKKMTFKIKEDSSVTKEWNVSGKSSDYVSSFLTDGWKPGNYHYIFALEDNSDNSKEYKGSFVLKNPEDLTKPTVKITEIKKEYIIGDTISFTVKGNDDKSLKKLGFWIKDASVKKEWNVNDKSASYTSSFSTDNWKKGTYDYYSSAEDSEGNTNEYRGSFVLKASRGRNQTYSGSYRNKK